MGVLSALYIASGVAVFILGMYIIKYALEKNYGKKLEGILTRFTGNRFSAVLTGALVTFMMQSSSASSVLTAAFVDSGYISLYKAFWIIVGANAGTTFTGLFTALDISLYAPVLLVPGILIISVCKKENLVNKGLLITGIGLIFTGLGIMGNSVEEIKNMHFLWEVLSMCSSPVTGITVGAFITAVIQSSSAVTAILQTLASGGFIGIRQAFFIILGSNIGTCGTSAIASMGLKNGAKKVALLHIVYNLAGVLLFLAVSLIFPLPEFIENTFPSGIKTQIAVINIVFNAASAVLALMLPVREGNAVRFAKKQPAKV